MSAPSTVRTLKVCAALFVLLALVAGLALGDWTDALILLAIAAGTWYCAGLLNGVMERAGRLAPRDDGPPPSDPRNDEAP